MIIFGTLAFYGFMMAQSPPKLLVDFNQTLQEWFLYDPLK